MLGGLLGAVPVAAGAAGLVSAASAVPADLRPGRFSVASITKQFTRVAIAQLVERDVIGYPRGRRVGA
ncbi:hypothetical protein [Jiangella asiatica]|uniref:Uncharacterized protein n=1 Tax=Jiangella asiatica TaxID=2530372 RepID=A0A4R5D8R1_9ACTN|nr:hypothetical protein [Jiangella asiatica]TDE08121.1 hypothetical protein E1269_18615 [Jiangella asiatica]